MAGAHQKAPARAAEGGMKLDKDMKELYKNVGYGLLLVFMGYIGISASLAIAVQLFLMILGG